MNHYLIAIQFLALICSSMGGWNDQPRRRPTTPAPRWSTTPAPRWSTTPAPRWYGRVHGRYNPGGYWQAGGGLSYRGDRWDGYISGTVDSHRDFGVEVGVGFEFKKRSVESSNMEQFNVTLRADPCSFNVYDLDRDEVIIIQEFEKIFGSSESAKEMFYTLDMTTGDGILERDEFNAMSAEVITDCKSLSD